MSGKPLLTTEACWKVLQQYYNENAHTIDIKTLFEKDPGRFDKYR